MKAATEATAEAAPEAAPAAVGVARAGGDVSGLDSGPAVVVGGVGGIGCVDVGGVRAYFAAAAVTSGVVIMVVVVIVAWVDKAREKKDRSLRLGGGWDVFFAGNKFVGEGCGRGHAARLLLSQHHPLGRYTHQRKEGEYGTWD